MRYRPPTGHDSTLPGLFAEALELDGPGRMELLAQARAIDPKMAQEVEALLEASGVPSPVDTPLEITEEHLSDPSPPKQDLEGTRIGGMEVTRTLGAGGMGTVFEAQQLQPPRRVALKVLRPEASNSAPRLLLEAEALSRLDHPSIAKVFGAGTEDIQGRPTVWMAFEFVSEARTLTDHADHEKLDTRERVALMLEVCRAIEHAHGKGVLHRDLKPANLLVSGDGERSLKVIDFGLARVTDPLDGEARERTRHGELLGTLLYMSPEQCSGDPASVDVRTDVYGLGIVLFELLTGALPYESEGQSILQMLDTIRSGKRRRVRELRPGLDRDLEAIVSQASAPAQDDRYPAAGALADDLERWLTGEPVRARRASLLHRARLFARRRKAAFVASAAVAVALLAAGTVIASLVLDNLAKLREIERRDEAVVAARGQLSSVTEILEGITARDPEARSMQASLEAMRVQTAEEKRAIVERAVTDLKRLEEELKGDPNSWIQLARAFEQVGELHGTSWNAGALDAEGRHQANLSALNLWRQVSGTGRGTDAHRVALLKTLVRLANSSRTQREIDFGKGVADEAVGMARQLLTQGSSNPDALFELMDALAARGDLYINDDSPRQGLLDAQESARLLATYSPSAPADVLRKLDYDSWNDLRLGHWLKRAGRPEDGAAAHRRSRVHRVEAIKTCASSKEVQTPYLRPSMQIRLAWQTFGSNELVAYRNLGDEEAVTESLVALAQAAAEFDGLELADYGGTLPMVTGFAALLADRDPTPEAQSALEDVARLWSQFAPAERSRRAAGIPKVLEDIVGIGFEPGPRARQFLADLGPPVEDSGDR